LSDSSVALLPQNDRRGVSSLRVTAGKIALRVTGSNNIVLLPKYIISQNIKKVNTGETLSYKINK
ncbi:MAG: hypothetical protein ACI4RI_04105, partial [Ruminococcus sp.]